MLKGLKLRIVEYLMRTRLYNHVLKHIIPYIRFTTYYPSLNGKQFNRLYDKLLPGDVILTNDKKKLTTMLIPGDFAHAALCVGKGCDWEVSEMTHNDYDKTTFFDVCRMADRVVILRPQLERHVIENAIERCMSYDGAEYDNAFSLGVEALYCSELVYESYEGNALGANIDDLLGMGKPYISPGGLLQADNLKVIIDSDQIWT